jgi:hypothetical protein
LQPFNSKVDPLNLVDAVLDIGKTPNLHFFALSYLMIHELSIPIIYTCSYTSYMISISIICPVSCLRRRSISLCYGCLCYSSIGCRVVVLCVFVCGHLWTVPSRRLGSDVLVRCDREFASPWPNAEHGPFLHVLVDSIVLQSLDPTFVPRTWPLST